MRRWSLWTQGCLWHARWNWRAEGAAHLDHALERSGLFPIEEVMLARTGVQTGELPQMLQTLAAWYTQRAAESQRQLPRAFIRLMVLISLIATGIALISFAAGCYQDLPSAVEEWVGGNTNFAIRVR